MGRDDPVGLQPGQSLGAEASNRRGTSAGSSWGRRECRSRSHFQNQLFRRWPAHHPCRHDHPGGEPGASTGPPSTSTAAWSPGSATAARSTGGVPSGTHGLSFLNNQGPESDGSRRTRPSTTIPLNQSARFVWYHDHAVGITRLNAYAGIASGLLIRDSFEAGLISQGLPPLHREPAAHELPLVFQDKIFVGPGYQAARSDLEQHRSADA